MDARIVDIWNEATAGLSAAWELQLGREVLASAKRERLFPGASMVKTLLAALLDEDVRGELVQLSRPVQVTRAAQTGEDGLLRWGQVPTVHRLADLILLMIAVSDNTATNTLIGFLGGPEAVSARFTRRGWTSRLHSLVGQAHPDGFSQVSIADHQAALDSITQPLILAAFAAQQDRRALARCLRPDVDFRHKTGTQDRARHDAGTLATRRGFLRVACFTDGGPQPEWVDHPACVAMGSAMAATLVALDLVELTVAAP